MNTTAWENRYRETVVCIDTYENGVPSGRFYNAHSTDGFSFYGVMDFLKKIDSMLDEMKFPQSFSANRSFRDPKSVTVRDIPAFAPRSGEVATFSLRILFRQNASWQGSATWVEGRQEESFRSALELLFLMDSAMAQGSCIPAEE